MMAAEPVHSLTTPLSSAQVKSLRAGDRIRLSGVLLTARDAAHKRLVELIEASQPLPIDVYGQVMYYVGPTPPRPGMVIGSAGPTTGGRMDTYAPKLMALGLKGMIGKGSRSHQVREAMQEHTCVYFGAVGGAGAVLSKYIRSAEVLAYEDLGTEAIRRLVVEDFPVVVINDVYGNDLYEEGRKQYVREGARET
jgi:fumarate hydratase subunit beta